MGDLMIKYDGHYVPRALCTIDRYGGADDCDPCYCDEECDSCAIQECFDKLAEYEMKSKSDRWIPVSERLPEISECKLNNGRFIITDTGTDLVYEAIYDRINKFFFDPVDETREEIKVSAWRMLPEKYEESDKGEIKISKSDKFDAMISAFQCDLSLAREGSERLSELDDLISKGDERILKDIDLLNELEYRLRTGQAEIHLIDTNPINQDQEVSDDNFKIVN